MTRLLDYIDVPLLHCIAISITFTDVENGLKIFSLLLAIIYTLWKWITEYKNKKNGQSDIAKNRINTPKIKD